MRPRSPQPGLFADPPANLPPGICYLPGTVSPADQGRLYDAVQAIAELAPFTPTRTRNGMTSAAMTNCGAAGWWSDLKGYRYETHRPGTGEPWPAMPAVFLHTVAAAVAGSPWPSFIPDACLMNFYGAGAKMGLHQDRDEKDFAQPIVTVSLGDDADFLIGGLTRGDKTQALIVRSGDILIMGGESRMRFHGIRKTYPGTSPLPELNGRISLTFRKAL
jgi:alkylated DNA repair protein (DNA oxidative demethylase)